MDMQSNPFDAEIDSLFVNGDPELVWRKTGAIIGRIDPTYDLRPVRHIFDDVLRLFHGAYPGYSAIKTPYHDLPHTMDVFMCAVRLMHGVHLSGTRFSDEDMTLILIAALTHDIGYAQLKDEAVGTGAQHTLTHVQRGIDFMRQYLAGMPFPADFPQRLGCLISCTDTALNLSDIPFPDERTRLLGQIVVTADMLGQMAGRTYLERLLFLYQEFQEANVGGFQSIQDLLKKSKQFYEITRAKFDGPFGGLYVHLALHFKDSLGSERNFYIESIEKNMAYLERVVALDEADYLPMLRRGGVVSAAGYFTTSGGPLKD
jgi:hypothetical protein